MDDDSRIDADPSLGYRMDTCGCDRVLYREIRTMIMNGARLYHLEQVHQPNTPSTHNHHGEKVNDPVQCRECLQTYPCDIRNLLTLLEELVK